MLQNTRFACTHVRSMYSGTGTSERKLNAVTLHMCMSKLPFLFFFFLVVHCQYQKHKLALVISRHQVRNNMAVSTSWKNFKRLSRRQKMPGLRRRSRSQRSFNSFRSVSPSISKSSGGSKKKREKKRRRMIEYIKKVSLCNAEEDYRTALKLKKLFSYDELLAICKHEGFHIYESEPANMTKLTRITPSAENSFDTQAFAKRCKDQEREVMYQLEKAEHGLKLNTFLAFLKASEKRHVNLKIKIEYYVPSEVGVSIGQSYRLNMANIQKLPKPQDRFLGLAKLLCKVIKFHQKVEILFDVYVSNYHEYASYRLTPLQERILRFVSKQEILTVCSVKLAIQWNDHMFTEDYDLQLRELPYFNPPKHSIGDDTTIIYSMIKRN